MDKHLGVTDHTCQEGWGTSPRALLQEGGCRTSVHPMDPGLLRAPGLQEMRD